MRTSPTRFYRGDATFLGADGVKRVAEVYSYESATALYDVLVIEGQRFVRANMGPPSNLITSWTPHHYAIEAHFGLA